MCYDIDRIENKMKHWTLANLEQLKSDKKRAAKMARELYGQSARGESADWATLKTLQKNIQKRRAAFLAAIEVA